MDKEAEIPPGGHRQVRFAVPEQATEIVLVRHGETVRADPSRPFPLLDGHGDPELAPQGLDQADRIARILEGTKVDAIYVTPLRRTGETAAPLAKRTGITPQVEPGLREVRLGEWEGGLYRHKIISRDPLALEMVERERWDVIPGAESNEELAARVTEAIGNISSANPGGRVVVFSHGGAIGMVLALATRSRPFAFVAVDNGAISTIVVSGDQWFLRGFNDVCHLA
ncbi:MAG: histidine phosphatase family protein [Actinomycetota bacterium]|jgi:probable phosphoglycerate mutase|nr:histidine phosphatase family protein [Actinomycetota bacterium]